jgi:hypothetical protein
MTGLPQFNYPAFYAAADALRSMGMDVVSPAEMDDPIVQRASLASPDGNLNTIDTHGQTWGDFLARDVKLLADDGIEAVVALPGWANSKGARLETYVAKAICGLPVFELDPGDGYYNLWLVPPARLLEVWGKGLVDKRAYLKKGAHL